MKNRVIYSFLVASLTALMMLACTDDIIVEDEDGKLKSAYAERWGTCFSSGFPENSRAADGPRKISVNYDMKYFWTYGDSIWVKDGDTFLKSDSSSIPKDTLEHGAHFYFKKKLEDEKYEIRYTGNGGVNGQRPDSVHITSVQVQTKLGSGHVGQFGDCGVDSARKDSKGKYIFDLKHKASFLLFTPIKEDLTRMLRSVKLRSIKVTKLNCTPGDSAICGYYGLDSDGLRTSEVKNAGKSITLNLFTTDDNGNENYWYELPSSKKPDSCLYMVLQPGNHDLSIEYELVMPGTNMQVVTHNKTTDKYEYRNDSIAPNWKRIRRLKVGAHTFTPNGFTKVAHKIEIENFRFTVPNTYYQWGASSWVYSVESNESLDGIYVGTGYVVGYPGNSDPLSSNYEVEGTPLTYNRTPGPYMTNYRIKYLSHPSLWLHGPIDYTGFVGCLDDLKTKYMSLRELPSYRDYPYDKIGTFLFYVDVDGFSIGVPTSIDFYDYDELETVGSYKDVLYRSIVRMPSANEMTYYLKYGDIHRDNTTLLYADEYGGGNTVCRGGIWIKKRSVIEAEGHPFSTEKSAYQINGSDLDLRYYSPGSNYMFRHYNEGAQIPAGEAAEGAVADVKYGKPANDVIDQYFFLPLLGYMHNVANSPGSSPNFNWSANKGQYKFVGAEGYYWTRTMWPNAYFPGEEAKKPNTDRYNLHGEREAYYLRITPYYVALCWDMRGNRMHGMVGNQRPDWYRTMPYNDRYYSKDCQNDTWFQ